MPVTNQPSDAKDYQDEEWNELIGLRRAAIYGGFTAAAAGLSLFVFASFLPFMTLPLFLRVPLMMGVAWLMFRVVEDSAGMTSPLTVALAVTYASLAMMATHFAYAIHGIHAMPGGLDWWSFPSSMLSQVVPVRDGRLIGWEWLNWRALAFVNGIPVVFTAFVAPKLFSE